jgi:hypothetical protein
MKEREGDLDIQSLMMEHWPKLLMGAAAVMFTVQAMSPSKVEVVEEGSKSEQVEFDPALAINASSSEVTAVESNLLAFLQEEQRAEIDTIAREFALRADSFRGDKAYTDCYQQDVTVCLQSFLASRADDKATGDVRESAIRRIEVEALMLAIARATPEGARTEAQQAMVSHYTVGTIGARPELLAVQIGNLADLWERQLTVERQAGMARDGENF